VETLTLLEPAAADMPASSSVLAPHPFGTATTKIAAVIARISVWNPTALIPLQSNIR
jgi:hypothetical protein